MEPLHAELVAAGVYTDGVLLRLGHILQDA